MFIEACQAASIEMSCSSSSEIAFDVVGLELVVGNLVDPGADGLAEELATGLAADRVSYYADGISWIDEAEGHAPKIEAAPDVKTAQGPWRGPMERRGCDLCSW